MSNYQATASTNYFKVKDAEAFALDLEPIRQGSEIEIVEKEDYFAILDNSGEGFPAFYWDGEEDDEVEVEIDWAGILSRHLTDNSVCIMMEIGHEKLCYVDGHAVAISSTGEVRVSLNDIYNLAREEFGDEVEITDATY